MIEFFDHFFLQTRIFFHNEKMNIYKIWAISIWNFLSANYWLSGQNKKSLIFTIKVLFLDPQQFSGPATIFRTRDVLPATRDPRPATRDPRPATRETLARRPD